MGSVGKTFFGGSDSKQNSTSESGNNAYPFLSGALSPSVNYLPAGGNYMGTLLGIPGYGTAPAAPAPAPAPGSGGGGILGNGGGGVLSDGGRGSKAGLNRQSALVRPPVPTPLPTQAAANTPASAVTAPPAANPQQSALQNFSDSAGMKFLSDNANRAIDNNQAAKGLLQSGSTLKGIADYNKGLNSTYLNDYLDKVLNFSKLGEQAANTLVGAGAYSRGSGTGSSSSKPGILPGMQAAAAQAAAAGA